MPTRRMAAGIAFVLVALLAAVALVIARHGGHGPERPPVTEGSVARGDAGRAEPSPMPAVARGLPDALKADFAAGQTPVWGVELEAIEPGQHRYWFYVDGKQIAGPLNPPADPSAKVSVFAWPPAERETGRTVPRRHVPLRRAGQKEIHDQVHRKPET